VKDQEKQYFFKKTYLNAIKKNNEQKYTVFEKIRPTVGLNICKIQTKNSELLYWDLGG